MQGWYLISIVVCLKHITNNAFKDSHKLKWIGDVRFACVYLTRNAWLNIYEDFVRHDLHQGLLSIYQMKLFSSQEHIPHFMITCAIKWQKIYVTCDTNSVISKFTVTFYQNLTLLAVPMLQPTLYVHFMKMYL